MPLPEKKAQSPYFYSSPLYNSGTPVSTVFFPLSRAAAKSGGVKNVFIRYF